MEELRFWRRFWKIMRILKTSYGLRYCTILLYPAGSPSCLTATTRKVKVNNQIDVLTIRQLNNFSVLHTKRLWSRNWNNWLIWSQFYNKLLLPWYQFTTAILGFLSYLKLDGKPSWTMLRVSAKCMLAVIFTARTRCGAETSFLIHRHGKVPSQFCLGLTWIQRQI